MVIFSAAIHPLTDFSQLFGRRTGWKDYYLEYSSKNREKVIDLGDGWIENLSWSQDK